MTTTAQVLDQLARIGATVSRDGDRLRLRAGPVPVPAELVAQVRAMKPELLAMLARPLLRPDTPPRSEPERAAWTAADWHAYFDEKAGIVEFDAGQPRAVAERMAYECSISEWLDRNAVTSDPANGCLRCRRPNAPHAPLLPFGRGAWLHSECWRPWYSARRDEAEKALAAFGIKPPQGCAP